MRLPIALALILCVGGCETPTSTGGPLTSADVEDIAIERGNAYRLPRQARIAMVTLAESRAEGEREMVDIARKLARQSRGETPVADQPLLLDEAMQWAQAQQADFLLTWRIQRWPEEDPYPGRCAWEGHPACDDPSGPNRLGVAVQVDDLVNGRVVDVISADEWLGVMSVDDVERRWVMEQMMTRIMVSIAP